MTINRFEEEKVNRYFYVFSYRKVIRVLLWSIGINLTLLGLISYVYFNQPNPVYYGTNGITNPIELTSLNKPNYSSKSLLSDDVPEDNEPEINL
jgi:hypothetical protein